MNIAVTGGAGFIGSHLCDELLKRGDKVVCIDNFYSGTVENIKLLMNNDRFRLVKCDVRDREGLEQTFKREHIELVYHYAAVVGVKRTIENPKEVLDVNIQGGLNVLEAALSSGCEKVINISSSEVYGSPLEVPEREDSPKNVETPYSISKLVVEKYAYIYYKQHGLKTTSLRLFNIYGPRQNSTPYGFVVGIFINRVLQNKPPVIFGDGFQTRDFTYVEDCIRPSIIAAESQHTSGEVFNIAAGRPVTILDLAGLVIELCNKKLKPVFEAPRELEIRHRFADVSKMRTVLGYKSAYGLKEGLSRTIEWYKQNLRA